MPSVLHRQAEARGHRRPRGALPPEVRQGELSLRDLLAQALARFEEIERELASPAASRDASRLAELGREHRRLQPVSELAGRLHRAESERSQLDGLLASDDAELAAEAKAEAQRLDAEVADIDARLKPLLLPHDPLDDRPAIVEIRAGTGGDEAALFAADLMRMYTRYCERQGWKVELLSRSDGALGGVKEVIFKVRGDGAFGRLRRESGTHRVQRVPATEAQGRIHTSAATVAVLPEAEEVDIKIDPGDLRIDVFRSSGPGGQSVNTTDSAVRITHIPTGTVVQQQDQKSQLQNKLKAMEVLRSRLLDARIREQEAERAKMRRSQVGSGDRSDKIRTYNFPQNRVTDHRIGLTRNELARTLDGELDPFIEGLQLAEVEELLNAAS